MKQLHVRYGRGREVLGAYWGFLAGGGIVIDDDGDLPIGQKVAVNVHVGSDCLAHEVSGTVVQRAPERRKTVIAFERGTPELLRAALAEKPVTLHAAVAVSDRRESVAAIEVSNISEAGCTVRVREAGIEVGDSVVLYIDDLEVPGCVIWSLADERGIMFELDASEERVRAFIAAL